MEKMSDKIYDIFLGKNIRITTLDTYYYRGKCLGITDSFILIYDVKDGETLVSLESIKEVKFMEGVSE